MNEINEQKLRVGYLGSADNAFGLYFLKGLVKLPVKTLDYLELRQDIFLLPFVKPDLILQFVLNIKRLQNELLYYINYYTMKGFCKRNNIFFTRYDTIYDQHLMKRIAELDVILTAGLRHLIPKSIYSLVPYGIINYHYSLLPKYRGTMPLFWQAVNQDQNYGFSFHKINSETDAGLLLLQRKVEVDDIPKSYGILGDLITKEASQCLSELLQNLARGVDLNTHFNIKRNEDYVEYIRIDPSSFNESLISKTKVTTVFIWDKKFHFNVIDCHSTDLQDMVRMNKLTLQLVKNGVQLNVSSINYIPAIFYYWKFNSIWKLD